MKNLKFYSFAAAALLTMAFGLQSCNETIDNPYVAPEEEEPEPEVVIYDENVIDFAAAADLGMNPDNVNGSAANGQAFYAWEREDKANSKRQDYKGYSIPDSIENSPLPKEAHVWRRSDRINGNIVEGGLKCPNDREMVIDGLAAGSRVTIYYDATNVTDSIPEILWAAAVKEDVTDTNATIAGINGQRLVSGESTIASGATIDVYQAEVAENTTTGYIAFRVKKGMIISKIVLETADVNTLPELAFANGDDLSKAVRQNTHENIETVVVNLPAGYTVTLNEAIALDKHLIINGDAEAPALIKATKGITTSGKVTIKNVKIDGSELTEPLLQIAANAANAIDYVTFENDSIVLANALIYATGKGTIINDFTVDNSIVKVVADITVFDFTKGSAAKKFNVKNSTLWATPNTSKSLYSSQGGQKMTELDADAVQKFSFQNSTIANFATTKNFFSHRQSNQTWLSYEILKSIFVDCGKQGQVVKGINGGQNGKNPTWNISDNSFLFTVEGVLTDSGDDANEATGDEDEPVRNTVHDVAVFADAANGDFTLGDCLQKSLQIGDPRWLK